MNPTAAQIASGAAAIRALWVTTDAAATDEEMAEAVLRTVHARAIAMDALERTRPLIGGDVAAVNAGPSDLRGILSRALRRVPLIEEADQATYRRDLAATLTAAAEKLAKP